MPASMAIFLFRIRLPAQAAFPGLFIANRFFPVAADIRVSVTTPHVQFAPFSYPLG